MLSFFLIHRFLVLCSAALIVLVSNTNPSAEVLPHPRNIQICGGIAGVQCAPGYQCHYPEPNYPDAQGMCQKIYEPRRGYIGIPSARMNYAAAAQRNSQWCWAAAIQMVLNYYGVNILQEQIVARTYGTDPYGRLPDWAGRLDAISTNLNNWSIDNIGRTYVVQSTLNWGVPSPTVLLQELQQGRPVIVSYLSSPTTAHAVVISGAQVVQSPTGPILQSLVVRDPWPLPQNIATRGRVEYLSTQIVPFIQAYWYVRVY